MPDVDQLTPEAEDHFHTYRGSRIPWYVHLLWVLFWCFAIAYLLHWFVPTIQSELLAPP